MMQPPVTEHLPNRPIDSRLLERCPGVQWTLAVSCLESAYKVSRLTRSLFDTIIWRLLRRSDRQSSSWCPNGPFCHVSGHPIALIQCNFHIYLSPTPVPGPGLATFLHVVCDLPEELCQPFLSKTKLEVCFDGDVTGSLDVAKRLQEKCDGLQTWA